MKKMFTNHKTTLQLCLFFFAICLVPLTAFSDETVVTGSLPEIGTNTMLFVPNSNLLEDSTYASRQKLLFLGLGELTIHSLTVKGNEPAFNINNPELTKDLSTNFRASLFADGNIGNGLFIHGVTILDSRIDDEYRVYDPSIFRLKMSVESTEPLWDTWRFTGHSTYDPNYLWEYSNLDTRLLTQPQEKARLEMFARFESDDHGYLEGGSIKPSFKGSQFSLHNRSIFGAYADLHNKSIGVEAVGGKLDGKRFREGTSVGFPADGTSGPYYLSNASVTRGSEEVKIEIRDRFDLTTLISTRRLIRDIDYAVDYERGRILLHQPVPSVTAANDPLYIVITYDYQRTSNDELLGGRAKFASENGKVKTSISYLHQFQDNNATGIGLEEPENLIVGDASLDLNELGKGYVEIAGAESDSYTDNDMALRAGWSVNPFESLKLNADVQRIEDNFQTFGNANITPTINQQRLNFEGIYNSTEKQQFTGSFRNLKNLIPNGKNNTYNGTKKEDIYTVAYKNRERDGFNFGAGFELRNIKNTDDPLLENKRQKRFIGDLSGTKENFGIMNKFEYGAHYERIGFDNIADNTGDSNTDQLSITVANEHRKGTRIEITQRIRLVKDTDNDLWSDREDATFIKLRTQHSKNFSTFSTYEYKKFTVPGNDLSFSQSDPNKKEKAGTIAFEYLPVEKVKALGKFTRHDLYQVWTDSTLSSIDDFYLGQLTYFFTHHFWLNVETEVHEVKRDATLNSRNKTWDIGARIHWNRNRLNEFTVGLIRREQLKEDEPVQELTSTNYLMLLNGSLSITHNIFALASVKRFLLKNIFEDEETFFKIEVGYENPKSFRVSLGYERIENSIDAVFPDNYYRGHGIFTRIVGKF